MANRIKIKGTSERSFDIGLQNKQTLDASGLTANRTWKLPDSNGGNGQVLTTDGAGNLTWTVNTTGEPIANAVIASTNAPMGFDVGKNFTDSTISFNNSTRTFTITPTGASFDVWVKGTKYTKTVAESVVISNTTASHYVTYNTGGVLTNATDFFDLGNVAAVAVVYWNNDVTDAELFLDERHTTGITPTEHQYLHTTRGAVIQFTPSVGFVITANTAGSGDANSDAQISLTSGVIWDEDLKIDIVNSLTPTANTFQQNLAQIPTLFRSGSSGGWQLSSPTAYPFVFGTARPVYNLNTGGTWSTPDVSNGNFFVQWVVATNNLNYPVMSIMGQAQYNTLANAQAATFAGLDLTGLPLPELRPLYGLVLQTSNSYNNVVKARLRSFSDVRLLVSAIASQSVNAIDVAFRETPTTVFANDATANTAWNNYVTSLIPATPNLQQTLTAGNTANLGFSLTGNTSNITTEGAVIANTFQVGAGTAGLFSNNTVTVVKGTGALGYSFVVGAESGTGDKMAVATSNVAGAGIAIDILNLPGSAYRPLTISSSNALIRTSGNLSIQTQITGNVWQFTDTGKLQLPGADQLFHEPTDTGLNIRSGNATGNIYIYNYGSDGDGTGAAEVDVLPTKVRLWSNYQGNISNATYWDFNADGTTRLPAYTLPNVAGSNGQVLTSNGAGGATWVSATLSQILTNGNTANIGITLTGNAGLTANGNISGNFISSGNAQLTVLYTGFIQGDDGEANLNITAVTNPNVSGSGTINIDGGPANTGTNAGNINITGGSAFGGTTNGGNINITGGDSVGGNSGRVVISSNSGISLTSPQTQLGNISTIKANGGSNGQFLQTDGNGNLSFANLPATENLQATLTAGNTANIGITLTGNVGLTASNGNVLANFLAVNTGNITILNTGIIQGNDSEGNLFISATGSPNVAGSGTISIDAGVSNVGTRAGDISINGGFGLDAVNGGDINITGGQSDTGNAGRVIITSNTAIQLTSPLVQLGNISSVKITGGSNLQFLQTDGNGNLSFTTLGNIATTNYSGNAQQRLAGNGSWVPDLTPTAQPRIAFTPGSNANNQSFSDSRLANFQSNIYASLFKNGVLVDSTDYTISGTTLTINIPLTTNDTVTVLSTLSVAGNSNTGGASGPNGAVQFASETYFGGNNALLFSNGNLALNGANLDVVDYASAASRSFIRTYGARGVSGAPEPLQVGDQIMNLQAGAYTGNGTTTVDGTSGWVNQGGLINFVTQLPTQAGYRAASNVAIRCIDDANGAVDLGVDGKTRVTTIPGSLTNPGTQTVLSIVKGAKSITLGAANIQVVGDLATQDIFATGTVYSNGLQVIGGSIVGNVLGNQPGITGLGNLTALSMTDTGTISMSNASAITFRTTPTAGLFLTTVGNTLAYAVPLTSFNPVSNATVTLNEISVNNTVFLVNGNVTSTFTTGALFRIGASTNPVYQVASSLYNGSSLWTSITIVGNFTEGYAIGSQITVGTGGTVRTMEAGNGVSFSQSGNTVIVSASSGGAAAGANTQVQYNSNGSFAASSTFTWNSSTNFLSAQNLGVSGIINTGNIYNNIGNIFLNANSSLTVSAGNVANSFVVSNTTTFLGSNTRVNITGGSSGQVLTTNGSGNLSWTTPPGAPVVTHLYTTATTGNVTGGWQIGGTVNGNVTLGLNGCGVSIGGTNGTVFTIPAGQYDVAVSHQIRPPNGFTGNVYAYSAFWNANNATTTVGYGNGCAGSISFVTNGYQNAGDWYTLTTTGYINVATSTSFYWWGFSNGNVNTGGGSLITITKIG